MIDLIYILASIGFFVLAGVFVKFCDKI